jgi:hypothetical protein
MPRFIMLRAGCRISVKRAYIEVCPEMMPGGEPPMGRNARQLRHFICVQIIEVTDHGCI